MWWNETNLDLSERTIGNILKDSGYHTGYFGKLHFTGKGSHQDVAKHFGFDDSFLYEDWLGLLNRQAKKSRVISEFFEILSKEPWVGKFSGREFHHEDVVTDKAIEFILNSAQSPKPYFCVVGFHGPHPPYAAPPPYCDIYDPNSLSVPDLMGRTYSGHLMTPACWRALKSQYFGSITWIDDNIGRLLRNVDDNTIVIFTSDHGDILGDHGYFSKGVFAYEGNIRVPLLMRFPNVKPIVYNHIVQSIDIVPTILGAIGIDPHSGIQGLNLFNDFGSNNRRNAYAFSCIGYKHRLRMVRTDLYKYWVLNDEVLFNLRNDPGELRNINNEDTINKMRGLLLRAMIAAEDPLPKPRCY
jgi:arylsulfatase A-like enzyme